MCKLSHKTSLLTSVKTFPSDHALCSTESERLGAVGTAMFVLSLCFSASEFSRAAFLSHVTDLAAVEKFSLACFGQLSGAAFGVLPVSEEKREATCI